MSLLTKLNIAKTTPDTKITEFLSPDYILVPIEKDFELKVQTNDKILKDQILLQKDENIITSPISGIVKGAKAANIYDGSTLNCVFIENDYQENQKIKKGIKKNSYIYNEEEILEAISSFNNYKNEKNSAELLENIKTNKFKNLVINVVDIDPSFYNKSLLFHENFIPLLDIIDLFVSKLSLNEAFIIMRNNDVENILKIKENIGIYPKIKSRYVSNKSTGIVASKLIKEAIGNCNENEQLFLNIEELFMIYEFLRKNKINNEKYISISGEGLERTEVIKVKYGTYIKSIFDEVLKISIDDKAYEFFVNGAISGMPVNINNLIVTEELEGIYISKTTLKNPSICLNCGKCFEICPVGLNPKYIMEHSSDKQKLKKAKLQNCIKCGLCSEICPSKIDLKSYLYKSE